MQSKIHLAKTRSRTWCGISFAFPKGKRWCQKYLPQNVTDYNPKVTCKLCIRARSSSR